MSNMIAVRGLYSPSANGRMLLGVSCSFFKRPLSPLIITSVTCSTWTQQLIGYPLPRISIPDVQSRLNTESRQYSLCSSAVVNYVKRDLHLLLLISSR